MKQLQHLSLQLNLWLCGYAAFFITGYRVLGGLRVPFGLPGPARVVFGGLAGVPIVAISRRNPLRTRDGGHFLRL